MKYGIVINPAAGVYNKDEKACLVKDIQKILGPLCVTGGLDTTSRDEFCACAKELSNKVDVLVVCGGDGTFVDVLNTVDSHVVLSYIPLGSGNALRYALGFPRQIERIARTIKGGKEHRYDVIQCDGAYKTLFASIGIDHDILVQRDRYVLQGKIGLSAYVRATVKTFFSGYKGKDMIVQVDEKKIPVPHAISVIIAKIPYYGYGLNVIPQARMEDGKIHVLYVNSGMTGLLYGLATACVGGNRSGTHVAGTAVSIESSHLLDLQIHGVPYKKGKSFAFSLLPGHLSMWH